MATEKPSAVDVLVVAFGSRDEIVECVRAAQQIPDVHEVVVVDHGHDGSGLLAAHAGARVVADPSNPGFGAGQNNALRATTAPYVLILNPDARPRPDAVAAGAAFLDAHPDVAVVQGVVLGRDTDEPERSQGRELGPLHLLGRALGARRLLRVRWVRALAGSLPVLHDHVNRRPTGPTEVESLAATAWLARREALEAVHGFDPGYFLYGEDLDCCRRLRRAGWRLVALPQPWATHAEGSSATSSIERELTWWEGTMRFAARWWGLAAWSAALVAAVLRAVTLTVREPSAAKRVWRATVGSPLAQRRVSRRVRARADR